MKLRTKSDLNRLATSVGATIEEDEGYRDMRVFQLVSPKGQRWVEGIVHIRVEWATGKACQSFNESAYADAVARVSGGLEPIPDSELYLYEE